MRHTQVLQAGGRWNVTAIGEYIHYEKGAGEIELEVDGEMHQLAVRDTFIMPEGYQGFNVLNLDNSAGEFSFLTGRGQLKVAASGQITEVSGIASTVDVNLMNAVTVSSLPAVEVSQLPAVNVATMPAVEVSQMPEVVQKDIFNILTTSNTVDPNTALLIPSRSGRKRIFIQAYTASLNTTQCRLSDANKTVPTGLIMACGGGLISELEQFHNSSLKFWNTSDSDQIEVIVQEEF
ncbi:hypothetical protein [Marinomonas primoryensis]|uniref:hypothetical protein n=1 Tax=Marinomonas primoryensis TaxID=178399 RepID=UPI00370489AA